MKRPLFPILVLALLQGCSSMPQPTLTIADNVDLPRFMGDWYVIANIPTFVEKGAHNAIESYRLADDGTIETTFSFNKGSFDGPLKVSNPKGFVRDHPSNAVWGMQFIWPIKAEFLVAYVNDEYTQTVIGRSKRDYVWIMARTPSIPQADYQKILEFLDNEGYDLSKIQKVPQQPLNERDELPANAQIG